jgi:sugar-specific transcriptional regulator TrmB
MIDLSAAGLNETEAKCYTALLEQHDWTPAALAKYVSETRTNCYKILDKLVEYELAERFDKNKKLHYKATNPSHLLELARQRREAHDKAEQALENNAQKLFTSYYKVNEQPGVRYYRGEAELKEIYFDQIRTKEPIYIIRPDYNMDVYDFEYMSEIRHMARKAGIQRFAITPDRPKAPKNYKESDPYMILTRTWLPAGDYTAPVEWNAYGDKLAIMSFGNEAIGTIIESPQIAESFRQLYRLLEEGLRNRPGYDELPKKARHIGATG